MWPPRTSLISSLAPLLIEPVAYLFLWLPPALVLNYWSDVSNLSLFLVLSLLYLFKLCMFLCLFLLLLCLVSFLTDDMRYWVIGTVVNRLLVI